MWPSTRWLVPLGVTANQATAFSALAREGRFKEIRKLYSGFKGARLDQSAMQRRGVFLLTELRNLERGEDLCDVFTYHHYGIPPEPNTIDTARPIICTEATYRYGVSVKRACPIFARQGVGWYMWGLAVGKALTPGYDLLQSDGTPFDPEEIDASRVLRKAPFVRYK